MPDAQGGVPTIMMEMLCYSRPGVIELLPALPSTLPKGSISGMLARTFARIDKLSWDLDERVAELAITSKRDQDITLVAWHGIDHVSAPGGALTSAPTPGSNSCTLRLRKDQPTRIRLSLTSRNPLNWVNGTRTV
jgi:hypothetical protein